MSAPLDIRIDTQGTLERLQAEMAAMPRGVERARRRALRKLSTWVQRQALREASAATGATQKVLKTLVRYRASINDQRISIWIGTNPLGAHHLGAVRWTPRMTGARAGRRLFPGAWSWSAPRKTAGVIMQRRGADRLPIDKIVVPIHQAVLDRMNQLQPAIAARFQTLLFQELNYALRVEAQRGAA